MSAITSCKHWSWCGYLQVQYQHFNASGGVTYTWSPTGGANSGITVTPSASTNYTVVASDAVGMYSLCNSECKCTWSSPCKSAINFPLCGSVATSMPGPGREHHTSGCQMVKPLRHQHYHRWRIFCTSDRCIRLQYHCIMQMSIPVHRSLSILEMFLLPGDSAVLDAGYSVWIIVGQMARQHKPLLWILPELMVWLLLTLPVALEHHCNSSGKSSSRL